MLQDMLWRFVFAYIDDILIYSPSLETHSAHQASFVLTPHQSAVCKSWKMWAPCPCNLIPKMYHWCGRGVHGLSQGGSSHRMGHSHNSKGASKISGFWQLLQAVHTGLQFQCCSPHICVKEGTQAVGLQQCSQGSFQEIKLLSPQLLSWSCASRCL